MAAAGTDAPGRLPGAVLAAPGGRPCPWTTDAETSNRNESSTAMERDMVRTRSEKRESLLATEEREQGSVITVIGRTGRWLRYRRGGGRRRGRVQHRRHQGRGVLDLGVRA